MARTSIPIQTLTRTGTVPGNEVKGDDVNRMYWANNHGETIVHIVNRHASNPGRVGFEFFEETVDGVIVQDKFTDSIPAGGTIICGPFPTQFYSRDNLDVFVNPVAGSAHSLWFRGYELEVLG